MTDKENQGEHLHEKFEPEKPIHRAVNITGRLLHDRVEPFQHDEYDLWKAKDPETERESDHWWRTPETAVERLAKSVDLELCYINECTVHLGEDARGTARYCECHQPDDYIECAVEGCDYPTSHSKTDHCSSHTWRLGRSAAIEKTAAN